MFLKVVFELCFVLTHGTHVEWAHRCSLLQNLELVRLVKTLDAVLEPSFGTGGVVLTLKIHAGQFSGVLCKVSLISKRLSTLVT